MATNGSSNTTPEDPWYNISFSNAQILYEIVSLRRLSAQQTQSLMEEDIFRNIFQEHLTHWPHGEIVMIF